MLLLEVKRRARIMLGPLVGACIAFYFGWHAVHGPRGIHAVLKLDAEISEAREILDEEEAMRVALERRAALLRPDHLDPDMLEERARAQLNFVRPDDVLVMPANAGRDGTRPVRVTDPKIN